MVGVRFTTVGALLLLSVAARAADDEAGCTQNDPLLPSVDEAAEVVARNEPDDIAAYVRQCKKEVGLDPDRVLAPIRCLDGTEVPITYLRQNGRGEWIERPLRAPRTGVPSIDRLLEIEDHRFYEELKDGRATCAKPQWLSGECWNYAHVQRIVPDPAKPEVVAVAMCRQERFTSPLSQEGRRRRFEREPTVENFKDLFYFNDLGFILTNHKTGKTCFAFQKGEFYGGEIPWPDDTRTRSAEAAWASLPGPKPPRGRAAPRNGAEALSHAARVLDLLGGGSSVETWIGSIGMRLASDVRETEPVRALLAAADRAIAELPASPERERIASLVRGVRGARRGADATAAVKRLAEALPRNVSPFEIPESDWRRTPQEAWRPPSSNGSCTGCHVGGPWAHSPWIDQVGVVPRDVRAAAGPAGLQPVPYVPVEFGPYRDQGTKAVTTGLVRAPNGSLESQVCTACHHIGAKNGSCDPNVARSVGRTSPFAHGARVGRGGDADEPFFAWMPHDRAGWSTSDNFHAGSRERWKEKFGHHLDALQCCCENPGARGCYTQDLSRAAAPTVAGTGTVVCAVPVSAEIAPGAVAGGAHRISAGRPLRLDGAFSRAARPGATLRYAWDFGDGTPTVEGFQSGASHVFAAPGTYTVRLTVSDGADRDSTTTTVVVTR